MLNKFKKSPMAMSALVIAILIACIAVFAPFIASDRPIVSFSGITVMPLVPYSPGDCDLNAILAPPSAKHPLGTDAEGRDIAAQAVWGARVSLAVGLVAAGLAVMIGALLGALAGFHGGWVDILISRLVEVMICFPAFFLILTLLAFVGPSIYNIMLVIGLVGWTGVARLVRAECLRLRKREFVLAAEATGLRTRRIILRHLIPNTLGPLLVSATFGIAGAISVEATLSFLGFGVPPSTPSWGNMLSQARLYMDIAWWLTLVPGSAIFITILAYNFLGESLRDSFEW